MNTYPVGIVECLPGRFLPKTYPVVFQGGHCIKEGTVRAPPTSSGPARAACVGTGRRGRDLLGSRTVQVNSPHGGRPRQGPLEGRRGGVVGAAHFPLKYATRMSFMK